MRRVDIFDTTLRDGEQTPGVTLLLQDKVDIATALAELGVDVVEAGFPAAAEVEAEAVSRVGRALQGSGVTVAALSRCQDADVEAAARALETAERPRLHVFSSGSDIHIRSIFRRSPQAVVDMATAAVAKAKGYVEDVEFSPQDATRSDPDFLVGFYQAAVQAGATVVNIPDTVGYAWPTQMAELVRRVREAVPSHVKVSVHCHDDLGLAVANSLMALLAGADQVECTINGIGERAGNASLEEIVTAIRVRADVLPFATGVRSQNLRWVSRLVSERTGVVVQPNKAVVGDNAFRHESGIHQDGVLKDRSTYEIIDPSSVGAQSVLVIGKHSGRHALRKELERLGFSLGEEELVRVWREVKALTAQKVPVDEEHLRAVARRVLGGVPEAAQGGGGAR
jgi:2-isopropylmalate synthase